METLSSAVEDYLKAILEIEEEAQEDRVSTSALAERLGVARASVTGMLKKLSAMDPRLVKYERYRGARLTPAGKKIALEVIRHHRLIECYLMEALNYSWDEVHLEADRLEHVISEEFEARIANMLGHPEIDPHGHPIPDREGLVREQEGIPLTQLGVGQQAYITRVSDHDPALLRYLDQLGLNLHAKIEMIERGPFGGPLHVRLVSSDDVHSLGNQVTDNIIVSDRVPERLKLS